MEYDECKVLRRKVSDADLMVLTAIVALAAELDNDLAYYAPVLGDIRSNFFKIKSKRTFSHGQGAKGFTTSRKVRARERFGS